MKAPVKKRGKRQVQRPKNHMIYCDDDVWSAAGGILEGIGFSRSKFCELILRQLVESSVKPFAELQEGLFSEMMETAVRTKRLKKE